MTTYYSNPHASQPTLPLSRAPSMNIQISQPSSRSCSGFTRALLLTGGIAGLIAASSAGTWAATKSAYACSEAQDDAGEWKDKYNQLYDQYQNVTGTLESCTSQFPACLTITPS